MAGEFEFVIRCLRLNDKREPFLTLAPGEEEGLNWDEVLRIAREHGVVASVHAALSPHESKIPEPAWSSLKQQYHVSVGRSVFVVAQFLKVVKALDEAEVKVLPYKGPVLSKQLFDQPGVRESKDIDLILHRRDVAKAKAVLMGLGYQQDVEMSAREERFLLESRKESSYDFKLPYASGRGKRLKVELHWRVPLTSSVPSDWYWNSLMPYTFEGVALQVFTLETQLIVLLAHGFRHYWESLKWLSDIDLLVRKYRDLDWDQFERQAIELGVWRVVLFGLHLSQRLLGTPLPGQVNSWIEGEHLVGSLVPGAVENMTGLHRCPVGLTNNLRIRERVRDRFYYLGNVMDYLFVPEITDYRRFPLPRPLWPIYWFIRPFKVMSCLRDKYGLGSIGRVLVGKFRSPR